MCSLVQNLEVSFLAKLNGFKIIYAKYKGIPKVVVGRPVYNLRAFDPQQFC